MATFSFRSVNNQIEYSNQRLKKTHPYHYFKIERINEDLVVRLCYKKERKSWFKTVFCVKIISTVNACNLIVKEEELLTSEKRCKVIKISPSLFINC